MEASSHGLHQHRLDGVKVTIAGFTNLGRDHLDYHSDLEAYFAAKMRLFTDILLPNGTAVINTDSDRAPTLIETCHRRGCTIMTYGHSGETIRLLKRTPREEGMHLQLDIVGKTYEVLVPLIGAFQTDNALCALGLAIASGTEPESALKTLVSLSGVYGRLELVGYHPNGAPIYIDYAHTPDALKTMLSALRLHTKARLIVVFGCGGDRDHGKRPLMGAVAAHLADYVIVTDDNPRSEEPSAIRAAILAKCPGAENIGSRATAIQAGIESLEANDLLVIAGKGHETSQIVGSVAYPFDDATCIRTILAQLYEKTQR
jgi:UDP-N-acetylmuramoyl-L-alanyl-D-glutamate--2,6-diaminopimelate ligase